MITKKVKTAYPISLSEVKRHLRIDNDFTNDDAYIEDAIIKTSTKYCENIINKDIAKTSNTLTVYDFSDCGIRVDEGNLISIDNIISDSSTLITSYTYIPFDDHFEIEFTGTQTSDPLKIEFTTGYEEDECPEEIKQAILIECSNLYDDERGSYQYGNTKKNDVVDRLLGPYRAIRW